MDDVHADCGHAREAHGPEGCLLCDCTEARDPEGAAAAEVVEEAINVTLEAPGADAAGEGKI